DNGDGDGFLPETASHLFLPIVIGFVFMLTGSFILLIRKNAKAQEEYYLNRGERIETRKSYHCWKNVEAEVYRRFIVWVFSAWGVDVCFWFHRNSIRYATWRNGRFLCRI